MGLIYNGNDDIKELYFGSNQVGVLKFGDTEIWRYAPAIPAFSIEAINDTEITVTFTGGRVKDSNTYTIKYGINTNTEETVTTSNSNSYTLTGLSPNTTYYFKVRSDGDWDSSEYADLKNLKTPPDAPTPSSATWGVRSIKLSWSATAGSTRYYIERRKGTTGAFSEITYVTSTEYINSELELNTAYQYRIRAYNQNGFSAYSLYNIRSTGYNPTQPTLSLASLTSTSINLSWTPSTGSGYYLERKVGSGSWAALSTISSNSTTSYSDTGLSANTSYQYRIKAFKSYTLTDGESAYDTLSQTTPPAAPTGVSATTYGLNSIYLSWNNASGATRYYIDKKVGSGNWTAVTYSTINNYRVTSLTADTSHQFRIRSYSSNGFSPYSSVVSASTGLNPNATTLTITSVESTSVVMGWIKVEGASGYYLERKVGSGSWAALSTISSADTVTYTNSSLTPNTSYSYRIRAFKTYSGTDGVSSYSSTQTITTAPDKVTGLTVSTRGINSLSVSWNGAAGATFYIVQRRASGGSFSSLSNKSSNSFTDSGLTPNTTYEYRIKSANSFGTSDSYSSIVSDKTGIVPSAPTLSMSSRTINSTSFSWNNISGVSGYYLDVKIGSAAWTSLPNQNSSATSFTHTGLSQGTTYSYRIRSYISYTGSDGISSYSSTLQILTLTKLSAPSGFSISSSDGTSLTLGWNSVSNNSGYQIQQSTSSTFSNNNVTRSASSTSLSISGLSASTTYYFRVLTKGSGNYANSDYSSTEITYLTTSPLTAPTYLYASSITSNSFTAKWFASPDIPDDGEYVFEISKRSDYASVIREFILRATDPRELAFDEATGGRALEPNTTYYFRIKATDPLGDKDDSAWKSTNKTTSRQQRSDVTNVSETRSGSNAVISWGASTTTINANGSLTGEAIIETLEGFQVQISASSSFTTNIVDATLSGSTFTYSWTLPAGSSNYYVRVKNLGTGKYSDSSWSSTVTFSSAPPATLPALNNKGDIRGDASNLRRTYSFGTSESPKTWEWEVYRWDYKTSSGGSYNLVRSGTETESHTGTHNITPYLNYAAGFKMKVKIRIQASDENSASAWYEDIVDTSETQFMFNVLTPFNYDDYMFHGAADETASTSSLSVGYKGGYLRYMSLEEGQNAFKYLDGYNDTPVYKAKAGNGYGGYNLMGILVTDPDLELTDPQIVGLRSVNSTDMNRYTVSVYTNDIVPNIAPHDITSTYRPWASTSTAFIDTDSASVVKTVNTHTPYHVDITGLASGRGYKFEIVKNAVTIDGITYQESEPREITNARSFNDQWMASRACTIIATINVPNDDLEYKLELGSDRSREGQEYAVTVSWGDNTSEYYSGYGYNTISHTYSSSGSKTITITGTIAGFDFDAYAYGKDYSSWLRTINISGGSFQDLSDQFRDHSELISVNMQNMNKSHLFIISSMFNGCSNLEQIIGTNNLCSANNRTCNHVFKNCAKLTTIDLGNWDGSETKSIDSLFEGCTKLEGITNSNGFLFVGGSESLSTPSLSMNSVFRDCRNLSAADLSFVKNFNISKVGQFKYTFNNVGADLSATQFGSLDLRGWNLTHLTTYRYNNMYLFADGTHNARILWNKPSGGTYSVCEEIFCSF